MLRSRLNKIVFVGVFFMLFGLKPIWGQDPAFSQFLSNPIYLNPALTGMYNGTYRIVGNYRDQWIGALDNPYKTFSVSGDLSFNTNGRFQDHPDIAAFGFILVSDNTQIFDFNTNQVALVGAYHKYLGSDFEQYIGLGVQFGLINKSVNYENITFQDQFNAINGYTLATGEDLPTNNISVLDYKIGLNYSISPTKSASYLVGAAWSHFTSPNISFYKGTENPTPELVTDDAIKSKYTAYINADYRVSRELNIQPRVMLLFQNPHQQGVIGSNFKLSINKPKRSFLHAGAYIRMGSGIDGFNAQAAIVSLGYEIKDFVVGLSYDHGISDLLNERAGMNTLELSIQYFGETVDSEDICPKF